MALRSASAVGIKDPRRLSGLLTEDPSAKTPGDEPVQKQSATKGRTSSRKTATTTKTQTAARLPERVANLGDEPLVYVQVDVPGELQHRMDSVKFEMALDHPKLAKTQLILAALLWEHVAMDDPDRLKALADRIDAYLGTDLAEAPLTKRVAGRVPASLKRQCQGAVLRMGQTTDEVSIRLIVSALIADVVRGEAEGRGSLEALIDLVERYKVALREETVRR